MESQTEISVNEANLVELANGIKERAEGLESRVLEVQRTIVEHALSLPERIEPQSILESRFMPVDEAFDKGALSCGAMTNIGAEMLKTMGYEVRKVHGEDENSVDHAWLLVKEPGSGEWNPYDLTRKGAKVGEYHRVKKIVSDWEEIREEIVSDHATYGQRLKARE
jgi:transglutaminase-like putative cysteine protease